MSKVIKVTNAKARTLIEQFTRQYTLPDVIEFNQDGAGNWVTSIENLENIRYKGIRQDFKQFLRDNGVNANVNSIKEALQNYSTLIDYVPVTPDES